LSIHTISFRSVTIHVGVSCIGDYGGFQRRRGYQKDINTNKQTNSMALVAHELYRRGDRRLSAKLVPTSADSVCSVVSATDSCGHILGF
jgi:hypothetical protein